MDSSGAESELPSKRSSNKSRSSECPIPKRNKKSKHDDEVVVASGTKRKRNSTDRAKSKTVPSDSDGSDCNFSDDEKRRAARSAKRVSAGAGDKRSKKRRLDRPAPKGSRHDRLYDDSEDEDEDDYPNESSDASEEGGRSEEEEEDVLRIDKIFACRWRKSSSESLPVTDTEMFDGKSKIESTDMCSAALSEPPPPSTPPTSSLPSSEPNTTSSSPAPTDSSEREMEYLVKFQAVSYRQLQWRTRSELVSQKNDTGDLKIHHFHRKMTPGRFDKEVPLTPQDEGNFMLYNTVDRVLGVRPLEEENKSEGSGASNSKKEYLVKWQLLGYAESTWELEEDLQKPKDKEAVERFIEINTSFEFPVCAPAPGTVMASSSHKRQRGSRSKVVEEPSSERPGMIQGEVYKSDAVTKQEGMTRLWQAFMRRKLADDGTYIPSIRRRKVGADDTKNSSSSVTTSSRSLMAHQQEGLKWLFFNSEVNRHGSLLADEMGLGKTCQSITFLEQYLEVMSSGRSVGCHALVVVQKSVVENWRREFIAWAPHLNVLPLCGGRKDREIVKEYEYKWHCPDTGKLVSPPANLSAKKLMKPDVVLVTYEGLRTAEFQQLTTRNFKWTVVVVDECQKVKGGKTSLLLNLLSQLRRELMILLTGTPVQNTTEELFPMLTLLHPERFSYEESKDSKHADAWSSSKFNAKFSQIQDRDNCMELTGELHQLMAPYILRREKAHVLKTLPPKTVKLVKIPLTLTQKRVYSALYHKSIRTKGLKFANIHMQLRKCCIHPYLIEGMEALIFDGKIGDEDAKMDSNETAEDKSRRLLLDSSGKFVLLRKMLESFRSCGRKVLIFSFFKTALDLIEDFITVYKFDWETERVDGETSGEERQLAIDRFNSDPNRFLFLCTTRAGGLGINLTAASIVIHLDSDFNPQHDLQAQARCHRIGQEKNVDVFHFIAEHTYEDYMLFTIAGKKLGLEAVLLGRLDATKGKAKLDKRQEEKVLRKGVFAAIRDDEAAVREAQEFAESSIEEILSTKATTVLLESGEGHTADNNDDDDAPSHTDMTTDNVEAAERKEKPPVVDQPPSNSLFSTAKFAVSDPGKKKDRSDLEGLDEDEPDFWVKVAQRLGPWVLEEEKPQELTRADRRRGRNVNYRSSFYEDEFYMDDGRRLPRVAKSTETATQGDDSDGAVSSSLGPRMEDEDDVFSPLSGSDDSTESDDDDDGMVKEDVEVGMGEKEKEKLPGISAKHNSKRVKNSSSVDNDGMKKRISLKEQMSWSDWTDFQPIAGPPSTPKPPEQILNQSSSSSSNQNTIGLPTGAQGVLVVLDLLYRCLRGLKRWRATKVGETGALRTDDIRDADRCSPWSLSCLNQRPTTSGADQLLKQSWLETLQEWKQAGIDWEAKRSAVIDRCAKKVLELKRDVLEYQWIQNLKNFSINTIKNKDQLIQQMNQFFVAEARRLALVTHGDSVVRELQKFCDTLAVDVLTGRHFSREFTIKKQTWIGAEDFCIKLVFVHLMAQRYASHAPPQPVAMMRWPPVQLEINWAIVTEVVKRLNKYTGGPERRRAAIHERFYNKLDSRWNHEDFQAHERDVLSVAVANGLAAHVVAEEMPSRSLERVKKGLRCPSVIREAQNPDLIIQRSIDGTLPNTTIVDVVSRFREICQELGQSSEIGQPRRPSTDVGRTVAPTPRIPSFSLPPPKLPPHQTSERWGVPASRPPVESTLDAIRSVLLRIGVHENDFESLRPSLACQSISSLTTLLQQLRQVQDHQPTKENSPIIAPKVSVGRCIVPLTNSVVILSDDEDEKVKPKAGRRMINRR